MLGLIYGMQDLVPPSGIEPRLPALGAQNLSHWTQGNTPMMAFLITKNIHFSRNPSLLRPTL